MKTILPAKISTIKEAKEFLTSLHINGEAYHPEDSAADIVNGKTDKELFTAAEAEKLDGLMTDIYNLKGNDGRHVDLAFDPCEFLLQLDEIFQYIDKSGRGVKSKLSAVEILNFSDEENWDGESLHEWVKEATEGDEWENAASKYVRL